MNKIIDLDSLAVIVEDIRSQGRTVVLCHGTFDLLHIGHIRYLRQAKGFGDVLIATISPDRFVDKGPNRPAFTESLRAEMLASLSIVDYVAINQWPTAESTLRLLRPDYYVKGADFKNVENDPTGKLSLEQNVADRIGTKLVFTDDVVYSSSNLINKHLDIYPQELAEYLSLLRQRHNLADVLAFLDEMSDLKVLVVGDAIIDDYTFCRPLGLSSKDPTLALRRLSSEQFPGGALAVARHIAGLTKNVTLCTMFGGNCQYQALIKRSLPPEIELIYELVPDAPTVRKHRYLDGYSLNKFIEIYDMGDESPPARVEKAMAERLEAIIENYDLVLAADFGHGAIGEMAIEVLCRKAKFLAVNTQANAGNRYFHTIFRYPRADFVSLAGHELELAYQDRKTMTYNLMLDLFNRLNLSTLIITAGAEGLKALDKNDYVHTPAVAVRTVDRVGAGDALFAVSALAAQLGCPLELIGLMGNIAGAHLVSSVGNDSAINIQGIKKTLTAMMK